MAAVQMQLNNISKQISAVQQTATQTLQVLTDSRNADYLGDCQTINEVYQASSNHGYVSETDWSIVSPSFPASTPIGATTRSRLQTTSGYSTTLSEICREQESTYRTTSAISSRTHLQRSRRSGHGQAYLCCAVHGPKLTANTPTPNYLRFSRKLKLTGRSSACSSWASCANSALSLNFPVHHRSFSRRNGKIRQLLATRRETPRAAQRA